MVRQLRRRNRVSLVGIVVVAALWVAPAARGQAAGSPPQGQPGSDVERLVKLNQGIKAYLEGAVSRQFDDARKILEGLRDQDPQNAACLYYLGLIYLSDGLVATGEANQALSEAKDAATTAEKATKAGDQAGANAAKQQVADANDRAAKSADEATRHFNDARQCLQAVASQADPTLVPVQAMLDLGIAQLASENYVAPGTGAGETAEQKKRRVQSEKEQRELAQAARRTLNEYIQQGPGKNEYLGYFFLMVANYRLYMLTRDPNYLQECSDRLHDATELAAKQELTAEDRGPIRYYEGLVSLAQGNWDRARTALESAATEAGPGSVIESNAKELIEEDIPKAQTRAQGPATLAWPNPPFGPLRFEGYLGIGNYYDTNAILLGKHTDLPRDVRQKYGYAFGLEAGFDISRLFTQGIIGESLLVGIGGQTWNVWQPRIAPFDQNIYGGRAYVNWEPWRTIYLGVQYDYTYMMLGHEPYISSNRITPVIEKRWMLPNETGEVEERARTTFYYTYDDRDYFDKLTDYRFERDGNYHLLGFTQSFNVFKANWLWADYYQGGRDGRDGDRWMRFWLGYRHRSERTVGNEFDLTGDSMPFGLEVPLPWRLALDFSSEFAWDHYQHPSLLDFDRKPRNETIQFYSVGITRTLIDRGECASMRTLQVKLRGGADFTIQDANIWDRRHEEVYSYDRAIYGLKLMVNF